MAEHRRRSSAPQPATGAGRAPGPGHTALGSELALRPGYGPTVSIDAAAATLGRSQHGLCTRRQLRAIDISTRAIHRRLAAGVWQEHPGGVIDLGTHRPSWARDLSLALLAAGSDQAQAWASYLSAGYLHQLLDLPQPRRQHVTVPRARRPNSPTARIHRTRSLPEDEQVTIGGFPATCLARTLLDLAAELPEQRLEPILWDACRKREQLPLLIARLLDRYPGRCGGPMLLGLLTRLHPQFAEVESPLEVYGLLALRDPVVPPPVLQYRVRDLRGRIVRRVDAAWPELRIALEFDGVAYHGSPSQQARDQRQRAQLQALGWIVIVVSSKDLAGARLRDLKAELRRRIALR